MIITTKQFHIDGTDDGLVEWLQELIDRDDFPANADVTVNVVVVEHGLRIEVKTLASMLPRRSET